jgi:hypothetical protein
VLRTTFGNDTHPPRLAVGLTLIYRSANPDDKPEGFVELDESRTPQFGYAWGFFVRGDPPSEGTIYAPIFTSESSYRMGFTVVHGTYVTIRASSADLLLTMARALRPAV